MIRDRVGGDTAGRRGTITPGTLLAALAIPLFVVALGAVPAAAHTNHATVDAQISPDGTVLVETALVTTDGWVVVHADDGGEPGEALGHAPVDDDGLRTDVGVQIAPAVWDGWAEPRRPWVVLHKDDGDGRFEPDRDGPLTSFGSVAGEQFALARGARAVVTGRGFGAQTPTEPAVRLRRVTLPRSGHLVVHDATGDGLGRVVGSRALDGGTHRSVDVALDRSFLAAAEAVTVRAVAYGDDGDGRLDAADEPVRAGNETVGTRLGIESAAITPRATAEPTRADGATPTPGSGTDTGTETPTEPRRATPTDEPSYVVTATRTPTATAEQATATTTGAPGFGVVVALAVVAVAAIIGLPGAGRGGRER